MLMRLWREDEGVLTFEWIMLLTLLVIGVIGGVAAIRDAIILECQGVVGAIVSLDQSYYVAQPLTVSVSSPGGDDANQNCTSSANPSMFQDPGLTYTTDRPNRQPVSAAQSNGSCSIPTNP
jgi:hypothetical protein